MRHSHLGRRKKNLLRHLLSVPWQDRERLLSPSLIRPTGEVSQSFSSFEPSPACNEFFVPHQSWDLSNNHTQGINWRTLLAFHEKTESPSEMQVCTWHLEPGSFRTKSTKYSVSFLAAIPYHYLPPPEKKLNPAVTHATQVLELHFSSTAAGFFNIITRLFSPTILNTAAHTLEKISKVLGLSVTRYVIDTKFIIELVFPPSYKLLLQNCYSFTSFQISKIQQISHSSSRSQQTWKHVKA